MASTGVEQADAIVVPVKVLEKAFGIKERRVRQLANEGILVKSGHGRYNFIESVSNYITHLKANVEIKSNDEDSEISYDDEHALHERAKREKAEMELQVMKGELHEAHIVEHVMSDMLTNFRARILSMPAKLAPVLEIENEVTVIQSTIRSACLEALAELHDYDPEEFYSDNHIDIVDDGDENDSHAENTQTI